MKGYLKLAAIFCALTLAIPAVTGQVIQGRAMGNAQSVLFEMSDDFVLYLDETSGRVEKIKMIDYIKGAIAAEMSPTFHPQALAAQGISAHTRALYLKNQAEQNPNPELKGAWLSANPSANEGFVAPKNFKALYGDNHDIYMATLNRAAAYAATRVATFEGQPILAAYHAMSSGFTENSENVWMQALPYLSSVQSEGDTAAPEYKVEVTISAAELEALAKTQYPNISFPDSTANYIKILERSPANYVLQLELGDQTLSGLEFRTLLGLRSSSFVVDADADKFVIATKGYGHGVGLSQNGADFMARQGSTADEIIRYYYPGCEITENSLTV